MHNCFQHRRGVLNNEGYFITFYHGMGYNRPHFQIQWLGFEQISGIKWATFKWFFQ